MTSFLDTRCQVGASHERWLDSGIVHLKYSNCSFKIFCVDFKDFKIFWKDLKMFFEDFKI